MRAWSANNDTGYYAFLSPEKSGETFLGCGFDGSGHAIALTRTDQEALRDALNKLLSDIPGEHHEHQGY